MNSKFRIKLLKKEGREGKVVTIDGVVLKEGDLYFYKHKEQASFTMTEYKEKTSKYLLNRVETLRYSYKYYKENIDQTV